MLIPHHTAAALAEPLTNADRSVKGLSSCLAGLRASLLLLKDQEKGFSAKGGGSARLLSEVGHCGVM